jgi:hypothetical protein
MTISLASISQGTRPMFAFSNGEGVVVRYSKTASTAEAIAVELASTCVPSRLWPRFAHLRAPSG